MQASSVLKKKKKVISHFLGNIFNILISMHDCLPIHMHVCSPSWHCLTLEDSYTFPGTGIMYVWVLEIKSGLPANLKATVA